jgi:hypothetical protein
MNLLMKKFVVLLVFFIPVFSFSQAKYKPGFQFIDFYLMNGISYSVQDPAGEADFEEEVTRGLSYSPLPGAGLGICYRLSNGSEHRFDFGYTNCYLSFKISDDDGDYKDRYYFHYAALGYRLMQLIILLDSIF